MERLEGIEEGNCKQEIVQQWSSSHQEHELFNNIPESTKGGSIYPLVSFCSNQFSLTKAMMGLVYCQVQPINNQHRTFKLANKHLYAASLSVSFKLLLVLKLIVCLKDFTVC